jgi:hypothetical protein
MHLNNDIRNFYNSEIVFKDIYYRGFPVIKDIFVTDNILGVLLGLEFENSKFTKNLLY